MYYYSHCKLIIPLGFPCFANSFCFLWGLFAINSKFHIRISFAYQNNISKRFQFRNSLIFNIWFSQHNFIETYEAQRSLTKILQATKHKSESNNNLLSALLTSHMLHISMNLKMAYKQVFFHFQNLTLYNKILPLLHFGTQNWVTNIHNKSIKHAQRTESVYTNSLPML